MGQNQMRMIIFSLLLGVTLLMLGSGVSSCHGQSQVKTPNPTMPNFPFTIVGEKGSIVFIAPEYYNQRNLHDFFLWHYKKYLSRTEKGAPDLIVFTEKDLLDAYLEDRKKPWWESEIPREYRTPPPSPPPSLGSRRTFYDAKFSVDPSEPLLGEEDDKYSRGFNVSYSFPPDLTRPHIYKTVVLRGSTWTQGKYNLQTREFPWRTGKITLTAYDIYNVEPASRY